jgi:hypothetical protein
MQKIEVWGKNRKVRKTPVIPKRSEESPLHSCADRDAYSCVANVLQAAIDPLSNPC